VGTRHSPWGELPKFKHPPVVEVAVAVEFVPQPGLDVIRLVQLHQEWRDTFPGVQAQPPLPPAPPAQGSVLAGVGLQINTGPMPVRLWMLSEDEHLLLQVQHDRLILNWRRFSDAEYPSYDKLREEFKTRWGAFTEFLSDLGPLRPVVAEVTFVNLIPPPAGADVADPTSVLTSTRAVPLPEVARLTASRAQYVCAVQPTEGFAGDLVVTAEPSDNKSMALTVVTRLNLPGDFPDTSQIMDALDTAHDLCVLGFADITTPAMHKAWGRHA
jgi:uncharacterized protein (TIGR04255 family)